MKKDLQNKLKAYSLAAGAVAAVGAASEADAQVVYTDVDPDITISVQETDSILLDLNNDDSFDFTIYKTTAGDGTEAIRVRPVDGNEVLGVTSYSAYFLAYALDAGATINDGAGAWNGTLNDGMMTLAWGSAYGYWAGVTDKYLGLRFNVDGNTHYAWARLDVAAEGVSSTLKDYAYESTPGEAIIAGEGESINEVINSNFVIGPNPTNGLLKLNLDNNYEIIIQDVTGKTLMNTHLEKGQRTLDISNQSNGIYIVRLINEKESFESKIIKK